MTEVLVVAVMTAVIAYPNPYTRMNTSQLILLLFSQCGISNSDNLWYLKKINFPHRIENKLKTKKNCYSFQ